MSDTTTTQTSPDQTPTPPRKRHRVRNTVLVLAVLAGMGGIASAVSGGSHPAANPAPPATSAPAPATSQPAASEPATSAPAAPAGTVSQQQALESAKSYLALGTGFSEKGLIDQLSSQYGDKFSVADATWAVAHSGADWNAQAVMSAKGYMKMGGFSRAGLIDQLTSPSGDQFTLAQATYAVNQVGL
jgi:Host cell surface-exposed lipoprotein